METIKLTIDNKQVEVAKGTNLVEAAASAGIRIPTLCYMNLHDLGYENKPGACRICVVEVEGRKNLAPACKTVCTEGMVVRTHTPRVVNARRTVMELILSNHPNDCLTCTKNGHCELQRTAQDLGIREIKYRGETTKYQKDMSVSIVRDMDKCIMCRRCETACNEIQSVGVLSAVNRGFPAVVSTAFNDPIQTTNCINCGQCVAVCPTGALSENSNIADVLRAIADPSKTVVVQTAPAVRVGLGQDFGFSGRSVTGKMVTALRRLGFDYVFDTDFAADLTIMEEGTELLGRLNAAIGGDKGVKLPLMTSCCPGWVSFMEKHFPELADNLSTAKSPQQMFGAIAKNYFAQKLGIDRKDLVVVSVMPCVAKKAEAARPEFSRDGDPDVNISITTRELAHMIRFANMDFALLEEDDFDRPLGESTGAGVIFGATGGGAHGVRSADEKAARPDRLHRTPRHGGRPFGDGGLRRNAGKNRHRPRARQCPAAHPRGRERHVALPCHRNHGMSGRLHRRRGTALPPGRHPAAAGAYRIALRRRRTQAPAQVARESLHPVPLPGLPGRTLRAPLARTSPHPLL